MANKSNIDYLRHILDVLGNLMGEKNYKESIEWLDAIKEEFDDKNTEIASLKDDVSNAREDNRIFSSEISDLKDEVTAYESGNTINTGLGSSEELKWTCHNMAIQQLMEVFGDKLRAHGPVKIENLLNALS